VSEGDVLMDADAEMVEGPAAPGLLYVRAEDAARKPSPNLHLERLLWSYNQDLRTEWVVAYGWPAFTPEAMSTGPHFRVAFVDEDAIPPELRARGFSAADLLSERLVWVGRARAPHEEASPPMNAYVDALLERPLSYERFCQSCVKLLQVDVQPYGRRFEYHTLDVLHDVWGEGETAVPEASGVRAPVKPLARYSLEDILDTSRDEPLVITRRVAPFALLHGNAAFWRAVRWERESGLGHSLSFLQGALTQPGAVQSLREAVHARGMREEGRGEWSGGLVNYTQDGKPFNNHLRVTACTDASLYVGQVRVRDVADDPDDDDVPPGLTGPPARVSDAGAQQGARVSSSQDPDAPLPAPASDAPAPEADEVFAQALERAFVDPGANVVITKATAPFEIVHVNTAWCRLCDFEPEEVCGKTLRTIQGPCTDAAAVQEGMAQIVATGQGVDMSLINYKKGAVPFHNHVRVDPVADSQGTVRYFVGRLHEVDDDLALPQPMVLAA